MTGIFDSGVGGLTALEHLRILKPDEDICYFADRENAPYGSKNENELITLVKTDIERLRNAGCENILAACCTASTVIPKLPEEYRRWVTPIIAPTAEKAAKIKCRHIGIIATEATVRSRAFEEEISKLNPNIEITSRSAQPLVAMVEAGNCDGRCSAECRRYLEDVLSQFEECDLLILGCTHFTHLKETVLDISGIKTLSPSLVGAEYLAKRIKGIGEGKIYYL